MLVAEKTTHTPSVHQPTGYKHCIVFRNYFQRYYPLLWLYKEHPYALWSFNNIGYDLAREECVRSADVITYIGQRRFLVGEGRRTTSKIG